jgi:hypothetical protein
MRISTDRNDAGYSILMKYGTCCVTVNGKEICFVTTADEELGYVEKIKVDENGNLCMNGNMLAIETISGEVDILPRHVPRKE